MKQQEHDPVSPMQDRISQPALRRLQLRLRPLLRSVGRYNAARQGQGVGHVGGDSPIQEQPAQVRDRWFAERANLGTPLSLSELQHGVNAGIIGSTLLN